MANRYKEKDVFLLFYYFHALSALNQNSKIIIDLTALKSHLPAPFYQTNQEDAHEFYLKLYYLMERVACDWKQKDDCHASVALKLWRLHIETIFISENI